MLRSEDYSDLLWDLLDQCHGNTEELRRLLSDEPQEVIRTFHEEFGEARGNLWSSHIENILRASEVTCDQMGDIFTQGERTTKLLFPKDLRRENLD